MRVIVAENDALLRRALAQWLRGDGIDVIAEASDGAQAIEALRQGGADVILTDREMDGLGGVEMVRQLRRSGDQTPVVMLSGRDDPQDIAIALAEGVTRYLVKPVAPEVLSMALRQSHLAAA